MNNNKLNPLIAIAFVLVYMAIMVGAQMAVLLVESIINRQVMVEIDVVGIMITSALYSIIAIVVFAVLKWSPLSRTFVDKRPVAILSWCTIAALGAVLPSMALQQLTETALQPLIASMEQMAPQLVEAIRQYTTQAEAQMAEIMSTTGGYAIICLLAPIAEEMVFRGAALRKLLEWKPQHRWLMITLSALIFACAHMNPTQFLHPLLIGLLLGWMYERTGSILPGIVYHWANNTAAYLMFRAYPDPDITLTDIFQSNLHVGLAVAFSLLIIVPAIYQLHLRMKR